MISNKPVGPTYCGDGCSSNCDATAPCGKHHKVPGTTCPLNTCCSEWGFCGTSTEFCNSKCQSNCELHPKPMASGGQVLDKVIGYYESWSARLSCHKMAPTDLPLDALTHLNYAFAYIDPKTLALTTMDAQTPESLFKEVADVKKYNSRLEVWISVGGWTFSDNGTVTQPLFGDIARSVGKRREFANNVLKFLNQYGYDGIDLDWEYPGAPDRGGKDDDTKNYVELLKQLRATFNASGRKLGITFTAPSSYWYLRWFDLPGMLKYCDWINVMTYDLHGTWDSNNPIGNIVQGHTNLTEIGTALELFWRVNIPPEKVFMGFGFYGRSFQLQDASCNTPGCRFKGGAAAGPCSDTSGILMYYEIMNLLKQNPSLKPIHDKDASVKYLVYNNDQWLSYDDAQTMKQKREWANKIGLGGSLIWASDADDDKYTAHTGLLGGKTFKHVDVKAMADKQLAKDSLAVTQDLVGQNGQECEALNECRKEDGSEGTCGSRPWSVLVGWEKDKCGKGKQRPICCPAKTAPKENGCRWRGHVSDCNGQCHPGESLVMRSSWGGSPTEARGNTKKCTRGVKAFCCDAGGWKTITDQCYWTNWLALA
ncbi:glycoside hydrolase [Ophiobolus disseminans]|uniref:chitinase n=1 Tax=Ophiobolus disseminans TaxID=1469910 RepID=A0A6A6ZTD9_9PLEO|nr:glycoside hydrolase [Ophiobolus disseminans]